MRGCKGFWRNDNGATAAVYALALPVLVAVGGVGFDYARLAGMDSELQNAADQAALAAVTQLDSKDATTSPTGLGACQRAVDAAQGGLVSNLTFLATDTGTNGKTSTIAVPTVVFYASREDAEAGVGAFDLDAADCDRDAKFVGVAVQERTARFAFTPVVGALTPPIHAEGVAGLGSAICKAAVLFMCTPNAEQPDWIDKHRGVGLILGGDKVGAGTWGYLGDKLNNNQRADALGFDTAPNGCVEVYGSIEADTGNDANEKVRNSFNTRFDMGSCSVSGNCSSALNTMKDLVNDSESCPGTWLEASSPYSPPDGSLVALKDSGTPYPLAMGYSRDICHASGGDCRVRYPDGENAAVGDGKWDIDAYFQVNHPGLDWSVAAAMYGLTSTRPGGGEPLRYDVYKWEQAQAGPPPGTGALPATRSFGSPERYVRNAAQCSPAITPSSTGIDRRLISVAVAKASDCAALAGSGHNTLPVQSWVDVFLVEPMFKRATTYGGRSDEKEIYVEIVRETPAGGQGENPVRRDVPYLVR